MLSEEDINKILSTEGSKEKLSNRDGKKISSTEDNNTYYLKKISRKYFQLKTA